MNITRFWRLRLGMKQEKINSLLDEDVFDESRFEL